MENQSNSSERFGGSFVTPAGYATIGSIVTAILGATQFGIGAGNGCVIGGCAGLVAGILQENFPNLTRPQIESLARDIELSRTPGEIRQVVETAQALEDLGVEPRPQALDMANQIVNSRANEMSAPRFNLMSREYPTTLAPPPDTEEDEENALFMEQFLNQ